jgi:hypothetical protein
MISVSRSLSVDSMAVSPAASPQRQSDTLADEEFAHNATYEDPQFVNPALNADTYAIAGLNY